MNSHTIAMDQELAAKVIGIVAAVKQLSPEAIRPESTFEQLGIDSLDRINILFELENEFDLDVPDDEARAITSVQGIVERLSAYLQARASKGA
jgi:acyl carrier protein